MGSTQEFAQEFDIAITEYCSLRSRHVIHKIGADVVAEVTEELDITTSAINSLTPSELVTYASTLEGDASEEDTFEGSLTQVLDAENEFDKRALALMGLERFERFFVQPGHLSLSWIDPSKSTPEEVVNLLKAKMTSSGNIEFTRRNGKATPDDEAKMRDLLRRLAAATKLLKQVEEN